jgi:hypothetical protein
MSRTYSYKPEDKVKRLNRYIRNKRINLADYELDFIETTLGSTIRFNR